MHRFFAIRGLIHFELRTPKIDRGVPAGKDVVFDKENSGWHCEGVHAN
jgi:hypothetical protein